MATPSPPAKANEARGEVTPVSYVRRGIVFAAIALTGLLADLVSKELVFRWRGLPRANNEWWLIEGFCGIETSVNLGALFGMGQGWTWLFVSLSFVAAIGIVVWLFAFQAAKDWVLVIVLAMVLGGIFGNLYDRLGLWDAPPELKYGVRDWILFRFRQYTWPNFNIADSLLVCGAIWLVWHSYWVPDEQASTAAAVTAAKK